MIYRLNAAIALIFMPLLCGFIDLEDMSQDFVLSTKKIDVPGYPEAFNPSIIRWQGRILLSFRHIPNPVFSFVSHIGLIWLNEDFSIASEPQLLNVQVEDSFILSLIPPRSEDPRLVQIGERLYIVYSDNKSLRITRGGFRVYIAKVDFDGTSFSLHNIQCLTRFETENDDKREKNWTPFEFDGEMLLAYSLHPHRLFKPIGGGACNRIALSAGNITWGWGELRGGTAAENIGDRYLSFFHSSMDMATVHSQGNTVAHYFMGAYTFSAEPPFQITAISNEPIVGKNFYHGRDYKPFWKPVRVVFPCGFIHDDSNIWIAYGRQDHEIWITQIDKEQLLESLVPVETLSSEGTPG